MHFPNIEQGVGQYGLDVWGLAEVFVLSIRELDEWCDIAHSQSAFDSDTFRALRGVYCSAFNC